MTRTTTVDQSKPVFLPKKFIEKARSKSNVQINEIHTFLEGSPEQSKLILEMMNELAGDSYLVEGTEYYEHNKATSREATAKKLARLAGYLEHDIKRARDEFHRDVRGELQAADAPLITNKDLSFFLKRLDLLTIVDPQLVTRMGVNLLLFGNCVRGNGTDEQIRYWLQERGLALGTGLFGCFAMTEMGHGSNVANIQTLATYEPATDTFKITTPDLVATKWWIGGAAHSATHATVYARLIVEGKDYGVKTFVVPLRDPETMELFPTITIGDIGAKMGRDGIDNGWIQFHGTVIPREYLLSRFTKITPGNPPRVETNNTFESVCGYTALLSGRVGMVKESFRVGQRFATIATRYAVGRQQFGERGNETQLIDYPLHQYRVLPQIALVYLLGPVSVNLDKLYFNTVNSLYAAGSDIKKMQSVIDGMKTLFIESAALKATATWLVAGLIDELRQSCGGHGYSSYNGFGKGYNDWVVQCTWEGDNNVLSLTSGKSILKLFTEAAKGRKLKAPISSLSYLAPEYIQKLNTGALNNVTSLSTLSDYHEIWAVSLIKYLAFSVGVMKSTRNPDSISKYLVSVAKFHAFHSMTKSFYEQLTSDNSYIKDEATRDVLWKVYKLFSVYFIDKFSGELLQLKVLTPDQMSSIIQPQLLSLLQEVKVHCIKLTDAFQLPDAFINAPIGYYDGDIYHNYFNEVTKNAPKDVAPGVPPYANLLTSLLGRDSGFERSGAPSEQLFRRLTK
ncbi:HGR110Wp [Eremothecium sinecaudum]|uniref:Acyl-coenzyme A oxidase n=1 Tax=Eremothecium sinecaudum TaxID=45286 RepID=A0A0X8HW00_9SACH|nr:HGR110Wp [Eremothecium sinecaudum]AMD22449.1 HGR110Wp [Eremothecium sinecaudum]